MGVFDYEHLRKNIKEFSYILFNYPTDFSKDNILENSYDGIVYEKRTTSIITGYDSSNKPQYKEINKFNPIIDLNTVTEDDAKKILNQIANVPQFAYRTKEVGVTASSTNVNVSEYIKLVKNTNFFLPIARSIHKTFPDHVFNKNIFKVTKLREEIFFINVVIKQPNKPKFNVILAVNDNSFWKRFDIKRIITNGSETNYVPMRKQDFNNSASQLIDDCISNPTEYLIKMRFIYNEQEDQITSFEREQTQEVNLEQKIIDTDTTVVEFTGVSHYNKRTWIAILTKGTSGLTYTNIYDDPNLESYKTKDSNTYYPGDESEICMAYR